MTIHNYTLALEEFSYDEVEDDYRPAFIDPGRRSIFTAAIGLNHSKHQISLYQNQERAANNIVNMLVNGTHKKNTDRMAFCKRKKKKKKKQKVPEEKEEADARENKWKPEPFSVGDTKKIPLIVVGNGMIGKTAVPIKGHKTGVVGVLWRALKRREAAGDLLTITIDEYKTSRIFNNCCSNNLEALKTVPGQCILACKTCSKLWNRDVNAAKN
ncbi:hypothetical protein BDF20DRAFT_941593, partial [Mycotypha africana]|uniref:uncharacterized protein n=1 Tax=Mycotypha africana TaxID=64632 RepID=UPI0023015F35